MERVVVEAKRKAAGLGQNVPMHMRSFEALKTMAAMALARQK